MSGLHPRTAPGSFLPSSGSPPRDFLHSVTSGCHEGDKVSNPEPTTSRGAANSEDPEPGRRGCHRGVCCKCRGAGWHGRLQEVDPQGKAPPRERTRSRPSLPISPRARLRGAGHWPGDNSTYYFSALARCSSPSFIFWAAIASVAC